MLQAFKLDGTLLWTINMGKSVREGEHDTQFMVYDLDGDGRAEIAVRTAVGTVDGTGKVIGDPSADWVDWDPNTRAFGKIVKGPEYVSILKGQTGNRTPAPRERLPRAGRSEFVDNDPHGGRYHSVSGADPAVLSRGLPS